MTAATGLELPVPAPAPTIPRPRPLRVMFVITCMPVGGAETLLVNLVRRMDRSRFEPELCCLKFFGPLGEQLAAEIPAYAGLLRHKYDLAVWGRLTRLLVQRSMDAVVTVGTGGDKMFWGRLAAWRAGIRVIVSALHSTGLPDHVEWPNRLLAPLTSAFVAVAEPHARYLAQYEGCPPAKVRVIPNGVDVDRFRPLPPDPALRRALSIPGGAPIVSIVAALRPEKNHELFLRAAALVHCQLPLVRFLIIGDGPRRADLEPLARGLGLSSVVHFLGTRADVPELLALSDLLALSSRMEANPVSILEAMACARPVVATQVGSISAVVRDSIDGYLVSPGDERQLAGRMLTLLCDPAAARRMGQSGRLRVLSDWSLDRMTEGYQSLLELLHSTKCDRSRSSPVY